MKASMSMVTGLLTAFALAALFLPLWVRAQDSSFHNAPASAKQMKNPYEAQPADAGRWIDNVVLGAALGYLC